MMKKSARLSRVPIRNITKGPKFHWFGYYDKLQFDPTQRYILGMEVDFEHQRPGPDDSIRIGMVDTLDSDRWVDLGQSRAWCWQTGCMLQWRPGSDSEIMWNDREGGAFVSHILNVQTGRKRTLPFPFFMINPHGQAGLGIDFERLEYMRPGYGYAGVPDKNEDILAPEDAGIYHLNLDTGRSELIISLADLANMPHPNQDLDRCKHYCNCLLFSPDGGRFAFLHRWRPDEGRGWPFKTRLLTAKSDGSDMSILIPGGCGHFNWRDSRHLIVQDGGFSIYQCGRGRIEEVGEGLIPDSGGHVSYLPGNNWIVGDTYPDADRNQHLYLYSVESRQLVMLGSFDSPIEYAGAQDEFVDDEWRCDLHPRVSPDGRLITIDSAHGGDGRQMYLIDVGAVVG
jgi:hypothetical protein